MVDDVSAGGGVPTNADFSASENGVLVCRGGSGSALSQLTWVDRSGRATGTLGAPADFGTVTISPDGSRVATSIQAPHESGSDIWILDVARNLSTRFTFEPADEGWPVWSADGSSVLFASNRNGDYAVYGKASSGVGEQRLVTAATANFGPAGCSRDGRLLACLGFSPTTRFDVWIVPLSDTTKAAPFLQMPFSEQEASISPDGKWIAYKTSESGQPEIYVQAYPGPQEKWQISTRGGHDPQWRSDGREINYLSPDGALMSVGVTADPTFQVGMPQRLFAASPFTGDPGGRSYAVSADGQRFLVRRPVRQRTLPATTVVVNWTAALGRK